MELKTLVVTQARTGSSRLPGKVLKMINGKSLLEIHIDRLKQCKNVTQILVATTVEASDEVIYNKSLEWGVKSYRGATDDVLDRFYQAAKDIDTDWIVRVTSDCPLLDPKLVDEVIAFAQVNDVDYCTNTLIENFPDGQDIEVFKFSALKKAWQKAKLKSEREHVTPYIRTNSDYNGGNLFKVINFPCAYDFSDIRMTVDELPDFELIKELVINLGANQSWLTYTNYIIEHQLHQLNSTIVRNAGLLKSLKND